MSSPLPISTTTRTTHQQRPLAPSPAPTTSPFRPRANKKMSIAQTYFLAHKARAKLSFEAARPDHNLRLLVGHANLLDSLMLELADAEREQESWFNQSVRGASSPAEEKRQQPQHIQWADTIVEEPEHDWQAEDAESDVSDSGSDSDSSDFDEDEDEDIEMADAVSLRRIPSHASFLPLKGYSYAAEEDDYDMEDDDEEDYAHLALQRSPSHSASSTSPSSPPELDDDLDDLTEDEAMPPSPPTPLLPAFEETQKESSTTTTTEDKTAFYEEGYYLPPRNPARLISAISVY
ncbi:hypothetical protein VTI74DRAFT_7187 [Chaetomium olivicolor]